jgi:type I restriction enzyme, S subunit
LVEKIQKKIELLKEQRTSLINHYVTKGLDPNVEMKDSGIDWIGEIPKHWNRVRVKHLVSTKISDGPHETPNFVDEGIPFLSVEGVVDNKIDLTRVRGYITRELHEVYSKKCKPVKDDILLVKSGSTTGKSTIVDIDIEFNIWSPLCILRSDKSKVSPLFLFNSVQSRYFITQVETNWSYGTQPNIGMGVVEELWVVVPPLKEQSEISKFLSNKIEVLDNIVTKQSQKIRLYQEYRQSLISSVVTGKVRVTEDMI